MTDTRWTPGPWVATDKRHTPRNDMIVETDKINGPLAPNNWRIASVAAANDRGEANAHLIAASPTMADYIRRCAEAGDDEARTIWESINATA